MKRILTLTCGLALVGVACGGGDDDGASAAPIVVENVVEVDGAADVTAADEVATDGGPPKGELWRWLALAGLIALVLESLFAAWIGLRRRAA